MGDGKNRSQVKHLNPYSWYCADLLRSSWNGQWQLRHLSPCTGLMSAP